MQRAPVRDRGTLVMGVTVRIGLTGGIASGKSTVADELARLGAQVIDADVLAHQVVEPGTPALAAIRDRFGPTILRPDGALDRKRLADIVFADADARRDLEAIVHPAVRQRSAAIERELPPNAIVVHVIPLLVETGQTGAFDAVIVVDVPEEQQIARLMSRDGLSAQAAAARLAAQASRADRLADADYVLDNSRDLNYLLGNVRRLWEVLQNP